MVGSPKRHISNWNSILEDEISKQKLSNQHAYEVITKTTIEEMSKMIDENADFKDLPYLKARIFVKYAHYNKKLLPDEKTFNLIFEEIDKIINGDATL